MNRLPAVPSLFSLRVSRFASAVAFAGMLSLPSSAVAHGGDAPQASAVLVPFPEAYGFRFGVSAALSDDLAIVGDDLFRPSVGPQSGAAFISHLDARTGRWIQRATLFAPDGADDDNFGQAVAIDGAGGVAVVGAPNDDSPLTNAGSVCVYRLVNSTWQFEQKLTANDPAANRRFGVAVAVEGSVIIIGSTLSGSGSTGTGSAYVFRHNGSAWVQDQKLLSPDPAATNHFSFGSSVAMENGVAVIGEWFGGSNAAGRAYVFHDSRTTWTVQQTLVPTGAASLAHFGEAVAMQGDLIVGGAPRDASNGSAFVFRRNAGVWALEQRLLAGDGEMNDEFGSAVTVEGEMIAVGAPLEEPAGGVFNIGSVYRFTSNAGIWTEQQQLRACSQVSSDQFGRAVAASNGRLLATMEAFGSFRAKGYIFEAKFADCNNNGITDVCDTISNDANFNGQLDACEIADGSSDDCDSNGVPDEVQATINYQLANPGFTGAVWGGGENEYTLWLNHHQVTAGAETITAVGFKWLWDPAGLPVTVLVYDDPNNDGNPNDAVLISSFDTTNSRGIFEQAGPQRATFISVPATTVGSPGDSFFIGAIMNAPVGQTLYPMAMDNTDPDHQRSWWAHGPAGTASLANLALNPKPLAVYPNYDFFIAAIAGDCNGNGVWDACDISDGVSLDRNGNGVPDECDPTCPADINDDGTVNVADLLAVITAWGANSGPADINDDGTVNVADLLGVIIAWGVCA